MKRFIATLALLVGLTHAAPITMLEVPDATALYDSSDPFAIGVSTAAYTSATNANSKIDAHILRTDNPHGVTAAQAGALTAEADTLATVAVRGGFAGTETIAPLRVNARLFGSNSGDGSSGAGFTAVGPSSGASSSGTNWMSFGMDSGKDAVGNEWMAIGNGSGFKSEGHYWTSVGVNSGHESFGNNWNAFGYESGTGISGDNWTAVGYQTGVGASGDNWTAVGYQTGVGAQWESSSAFGNFAGGYASGTNRFYADNYLTSPPSTVGYATNDMIFGDNGQLNLGRTGALTNALPNQLRGRWQGNGSEFTGPLGTTLTDYATVTNIVLANLTTTADIRTPLVNVTTGATSTVTVTTAKRVYYVEASAQTTVTNDISALALNCTSNAEWEIWYNATSTNALTPAWDSRMTFADGTPDMTCTGVYKFACSSPCGSVIQSRQIWPAVETVSRKSIGLKNSVSITANYHQFMTDVVTAGETNGFVIAANDTPNDYTYLRVSTHITTTAGYTTNTWLTVGSYAFVANAVTPGTETNMLAKTYADYKVYVVPPVASYAASESYSHYIRLSRNDLIPAPGVARITSVYSRKANNNEIRHYLAGGRDFR